MQLCSGKSQPTYLQPPKSCRRCADWAAPAGLQDGRALHNDGDADEGDDASVDIGHGVQAHMNAEGEIELRVEHARALLGKKEKKKAAKPAAPKKKKHHNPHGARHLLDLYELPLAEGEDAMGAEAVEGAAGAARERVLQGKPGGVMKKKKKAPGPGPNGQQLRKKKKAAGTRHLQGAADTAAHVAVDEARREDPAGGEVKVEHARALLGKKAAGKAHPKAGSKIGGKPGGKSGGKHGGKSGGKRSLLVSAPPGCSGCLPALHQPAGLHARCGCVVAGCALSRVM